MNGHVLAGRVLRGSVTIEPERRSLCEIVSRSINAGRAATPKKTGMSMISAEVVETQHRMM